MVQLTISSILVDFPYEPYPAQIRYMSCVIDALRSGQNALLESPTGTGKTLCLLCAALAWKATYVAALQAQTLPNNQNSQIMSRLLSDTGLRPIQGAASALSTVIQPQANPQLAIPRIVFSSRTHSQLSQAVAELKKTVYSPCMSILASRDQLCIHDVANNFSGSRLNAMCRRITAPSRRQCRFHLPIASPRPYENRSAELVDKVHSQSPMDIEDLLALGNREGACPFFLSRAAAQAETCEILFLPYNYLLDRAARQSLDIDWANDIIIIDEAHNLESICSDSMSFDLTASIRTACDSELSKLIEKGLRPGGLSIPALEKIANSDEGIDSVLGSENSSLLEIRLMRSVLAAVEEFINGTKLDRGKNSDISYTVFPGDQLCKVMEQAGGPTLQTYELFLEMLDRAMDMQAEAVKLNETNVTALEGAASSTGNSGIRVLQTAIRVLFESLAEGKGRGFRTVIQSTASRASSGRTLSYWCFKPSIAMNALKLINMRCLLLTSGTLSPLDSFAVELGLPFPVRLENPHVVTGPQVWAGVVRSGPDSGTMKGSRLTSAYFARGENSSVELGRCIERFAATVPGGLLVFYPSYASLYACIDVWKRLGPGPDRSKPSIWEHLLRLKRIVVEERDSSKVSAAVLAHRTNVDGGNGSILLAVCRGKLSEGIDFSDEYGRAVIITGLPYPSAMDPKVVLKREYADEEAKLYRENSGNAYNGANELLNGAQWYTAQALRAVNQAVGRAIRHRFDYGAILLCDERFQSVPLQGLVSKWLRPSIKTHTTFASAEASLKRFFADAAESAFAKEGEKRRSEARKRHQEVADRRRASQQEDTDAVLLAQGAINRLLPPSKTEAQFLDQMVSLSSEIDAERKAFPANQLGDKHKHIQGPHNASAVLQLSSQGAEGGLRDSGGISMKSSIPAISEKAAVKRTAVFLETRVEGTNSDEPNRSSNFGTSKRVRRTLSVNDGAGTPRSCTKSRTGKLSDMIKRVFDKQDVRPFLELFRHLLAAHSKIVDGVGPLQSAHDLDKNQEFGKVKVREIVKFTRENAKSGSDAPSAERLLQEIKTKIPAAFQESYEEALKM